MSQLKGDALIPPTILSDGGPSPTGWSWRRGGGEAFQYTWKGTFPALSALSAQLSMDFDSLEIRKAAGDGDFYELQAAQAGEEVTEIHEVNGSQMMMSKFESLVLKKQFQALLLTPDGGTEEPVPEFNEDKYVATIAELGRIATAYMGDNSTEAKQTMLTRLSELFSCDPVKFDTGEELELVANFIYDLRKGEHVMQVQYIYRHSLVFPDRIFRQNIGDIPGIYSNVLKVHTEAQMRTAENIPSVAGNYFTLPTSIIVPGNTALWLKQPPKVSLTMFQRREIQIEYLFADMFSSLYFENAASVDSGIR